MFRTPRHPRLSRESLRRLRNRPASRARCPSPISPTLPPRGLRGSALRLDGVQLAPAGLDQLAALREHFVKLRVCEELDAQLLPGGQTFDLDLDYHSVELAGQVG